MICDRCKKRKDIRYQQNLNGYHYCKECIEEVERGN